MVNHRIFVLYICCLIFASLTLYFFLCYLGTGNAYLLIDTKDNSFEKSTDYGHRSSESPVKEMEGSLLDFADEHLISVFNDSELTKDIGRKLDPDEPYQTAERQAPLVNIGEVRFADDPVIDNMNGIPSDLGEYMDADNGSYLLIEDQFEYQDIGADMNVEAEENFLYSEVEDIGATVDADIYISD